MALCLPSIDPLRQLIDAEDNDDAGRRKRLSMRRWLSILKHLCSMIILSIAENQRQECYSLGPAEIYQSLKTT